ncbi:MAG: ABC transporter permease subunit, partial [Solobacterium sp.]|nr:ABC transporter permease subunit [Solobacterium sp.]
IPIVNGIPSSIILCISGALITESAFAVPGMGKMLPNAINQLNNNMVITLTFIFTALSILAVLIGDLLMVAVDPRISLTAKGGE